MARPAKWNQPLRRRKPLVLQYRRIVSVDLSQPGAIVEKTVPHRDQFQDFLREVKAIATSRLADPFTDQEWGALFLVRRGLSQGTILRKTGISKSKLHRIREYLDKYDRRRVRVLRGSRRS